MDEAEEVLDVVFPSGDEAAEVVHPGEEPFHFPASTVAAQFASVLSLASALSGSARSVRCRIRVEFFVERVRVVGLVADEPGGKFVEEASGKNLFHKLALGWRSALDRYGERKTVISGDSDDLRALAAAGGADGEAPFLALAKVASTNASSRFSWPRSCRCLPAASAPVPASRSAPTAGTCDGRSGRVDTSPATRAIARRCPTPTTRHSARHGCRATDDHGYPPDAAAAAPVLPTAHCSSFSSQRPVIGACGDPQSISRMPPRWPFTYL